MSTCCLGEERGEEGKDRGGAREKRRGNSRNAEGRRGEVKGPRDGDLAQSSGGARSLSLLGHRWGTITSKGTQWYGSQHMGA